jgi:hypothetical protein
VPAIDWSETDDGKEWDEFVARNHGTAFQSWAWRGVLETASRRPKYLACRDSRGTLKAICPLFMVKGRYLSNLDSFPGGIRGGPLFDSGAKDISIAMESLERTLKSSIWNRIEFLRITTCDKEVINSLVSSGSPYEIGWGIFVLDMMEVAPDHIWKKLFNRVDRQDIKYFDRLNYSSRLAENDKEYEEFLDLENRSMKRQGHHPLSRERFFKMRSILGGNFQILEVTSPNGGLVAGLTMVSNPDRTMVHLLHVGYSRDKNSKSSYMYVLWQEIGRALEEGFRYVDFGGTNPNPADPVNRIKRKLGGSYVPLYAFTIPTWTRMYGLARRLYSLTKH